MGDITRLLQTWRNGGREAENELFALVLPDLRRLAHFLIQRERKGHSLQATELVDEIFFRLVKAKDRDWQSRQHFFAVAARAMRRHLIDHARRRPTAEVIPLEAIQDIFPAGSDRVGLVLVVDELLEKLAAVKPEWCTVVELKYFAGFTDVEAAEVMGVKLRTLQRMWLDARIWLFEQMESPDNAKSA
jgi:RNA polymerase sigma factor (TIGR02999 family)